MYILYISFVIRQAVGFNPAGIVHLGGRDGQEKVQRNPLQGIRCGRIQLHGEPVADFFSGCQVAADDVFVFQIPVLTRELEIINQPVGFVRWLGGPKITRTCIQSSIVLVSSFIVK